MIDYAEKRDFLRMAIDCELSFSAAGSTKRYTGSVINLSTKGILFTSSEKFDDGTVLKLTLTPSHSDTLPMEATAVVTRVINNDVLYEVACEIKLVKG